MKKILRILLFGALIWLICFIIGIILFPLHDSRFMLFKSIMIVASTIVGVYFLAVYFKKINENYIKEGVLTGIIWFITNIVLDLIVLVGILGTPLVDYLISPGIIYLNMPVMSIGIGYLLSKKK